jgi:L-ascorbate metabolism protein UlaG (beta-lactamase superfamily)
MTTGDSRGRRPWDRVVAATRSGLRRYPRHLSDALRGRPLELQAIPHPALPEDSRMSAVWLGHATTLIRLSGMDILTDPVLSDRIGMSVRGRTLGLPRLLDRPPELTAPPRVILLSHAHFDHLDKPSLRRLVDPETVVVTARRTGKLVPRGFGDVIELDWGRATTIDGVEIGAIQPRHWGARAAIDHWRGYNAYCIARDGRSALFAGDTALTSAFQGMRPDLAVFGIGSYEPWEHAHATPEQVWTMFEGAEGDCLLPIHHSTFEMGDEAHGEPLRRLVSAAGADEHRIVGRGLGEVWAGPTFGAG